MSSGFLINSCPVSLISQFKTFRQKEKDPSAEEEEKEMSFLDHLEELRWHLLRSLAMIVIIAVVMYFNMKWLLDDVILAPFRPEFPTNRLLCQIQQALCFDKIDVIFISISPYEQFLKSITIGLIAGFIFSFPYFLWEIWRFVKPGLKPTERGGLQGNIFVMSVLFFAGVAFSYYVITPFSVQFLSSFKISDNVENQWRIGEVISMVTQIALGGGIVFEMPVVAYYLSRMGVISPEFLRTYRRHAIVVLLVVAAVITPPDWLSQILIFIPLQILYEVSIGISAIAVRQRDRQQKEEEKAEKERAEKERAEREKAEKAVAKTAANEEDKA
ncbi:MAG: twin-arginine translocase subunit TatC [Bacteroidetes bacterium]|nr:MAG: twin-arginine translocase subunit TatC [Bacteroidota bacterium]